MLDSWVQIAIFVSEIAAPRGLSPRNSHEQKIQNLLIHTYSNTTSSAHTHATQTIEMSSDVTKKRRVGDDDHNIDSGDTASPMDVVSEPKDKPTTLAAIMAEMKGMRYRMDEMETSKQNEIDSMISRISQMEDQNKLLQVKCDSLERS